VLEASVDWDDYSLLCRQHNTRVWGATDDIPIKAAKISSGDFRRAMEAVYGHKIIGHVCNSYLAKTAELGILSNMHFNARDVHNIDRISHGNCSYCVAVKTKATSMKPAHRWNSFDTGLQMLPDTQYCYPADTSSRRETIGFDHMFIDQRPVLVAVGQNRNYVHVIPMMHGRKEKYIKEAI